MSIKEFAL